MIMGKLNFDEVMANLKDAMDELEGDVIEEMYNQVCSKKIRYVDDGIWELTGEDDSVEN
jgi:hypothetical protein